ncbi:MAG TPA: helix-turn-helix transcriptional regulator [Clostridiales bacterium]|nr:helix-turn-helix transcriptional regulator [Clostridiales bacterium]
MPKDAREIFAQNLRELLRRTGRTQADLVRELELRQSTVSDWMSGKKYPRVDKIQLLADYLGVNRSDLTEERSDSIAPGTREWLREGLVARGCPGAEELEDHQLEAILESMDLLVRAFVEKKGSK